MKNFDSKQGHVEADFSLDITSDVCPLTFVKTKLLSERMEKGQTAIVRLRGAEPLLNVPRSLREHGHEIVSLMPEQGESQEEGVHSLIFRKN
jgi:tRNA 2-thiouridine synthesizing protein A